MNKAARKQLDEVIKLIDEIDLDNIEQQLTDIQYEEQEKFENLSEGLQASDQGQSIETAAAALQEAVEAVAEARLNLEEAKNQIEEAQA